MSLRAASLACLLVVAGVAGAVTAASVASEADRPTDRPPADRLVSPDGTESYVWPYTSRAQSPAGRTLALNVVVDGESDRVRRLFVARSDADWGEVERNEAVRVPPWRPAHGSVRYTYLTDDPNAPGHWVRPAYQLAVGTYFGERTHIRAYPGRSGNWTAIQAHTEYWDWFRVRHTVTGVAAGARFVEDDLRGERAVASVTRPAPDTGSRWTVVELASAALAALGVPLTARRAREGLGNRGVPLAAALLALVLGVRAWGLAGEAAFPALDPKLFVALGYPVLALGPPTLVAAFARVRPTARRALPAVVGFGAGVALDTLLVAGATLPPELALHRASLTAALGVIALGVDGDRRLLAAGALGWVTLLGAPLLGVL